MKKIILTAAVILSAVGFCQAQKPLRKAIIGQWCNPYTYESTGELKGFEFKKDGKCRAINIPSLKLKSWRIDDEGYLCIEGTDVHEDGTTEPYSTRERIENLTADSLVVIAREKNPKLVFLYINTKRIRQLVTPQNDKQ